MKNKDRILAIDFVRGLSVMLMIPVHCMIIYASIDTWENSILGKIIQVLEQGTPMFLIVMGISFAFSKRQTFKAISIRGFNILGLGYVLNCFRFLIPIVLFGGLPVLFVKANRIESDIITQVIYFFLLGDILQLAGLSLLLMGLILKWVKNKYVPLILGLLIVAFSREVSGFRIGTPVLDYMCDLLWGNQYNVYFPAFPWMAFILIGLFFGMWYKEKKENVQYVYQRMLYCSFGFVSIGMLLCTLDYEYHFGDYYHLGPGGSIVLLGLNLFLIWVGHLFVKYFKPNKFYSLLYYCSKNVTAFYVIQWILINWSMSVFGYANQDQVDLLFIIAVITTMTFGILYIKNKSKDLVPKFKKQNEECISKVTE